MKIKTYIADADEIDLPKYDYNLLKKELENQSGDYKERSQKLNDLRSEKISPFGGLEINGDPMIGRPTLSEGAPVLWYRSLVHIGMRNYLRKTIGEEIDIYLYKAGKEAGKYMFEIGLIEKKENIDEQIDELQKKLKDFKVGILEVLESTEDCMKIRIDECISCAGVANIGEVVCFWEGGVIAGLFTGLMGKKAEAVEYNCWGKGNETCEFEVFIGDDAVERYQKRYKDIKTNLLLN